MHTSDSEDFESADEGHGSPEKKERKKRLSSSNYSDNALETDQQPQEPKPSANVVKNIAVSTKSLLLYICNNCVT